MSENAFRYAVLDENGVKINGILVNNPYPQDYWPGYGRYIVCDYGEQDPIPPENLELRSGDRPFSYLTIRPNSIFNIGDSMDIITGEVTITIRPELILVDEANTDQVII